MTMVKKQGETEEREVSEGQSSPLVSIGMPVFNGEPYIGEAIESILRQSYRNIELIICDNASEDGTQAICERFAAEDSRVRYVRNEANIGAYRNFNKTFELSRGKYFKWASHDDNLEEGFIEVCVDTLERETDVVLCLPKIIYIDQHGKITADQTVNVSILGERYLDRMRRFFDLQVASDDIVYALFGLMRADALRKTKLWEPYISSEEMVMLDLLRYGKLKQVEQSAFFFRLHPQSAFKKNRKPKDRARWFDPSRKRIAFVFPVWNLLRKYLGRVIHGPFTLREKIIGVGLVLYRALRLWRRYVGDIVKFFMQFLR